MSMSLHDVYTTRRGVAGGPAGQYPTPGASITQSVSAPTNGPGGSIGTMSGSGGSAPAVSWVVLVGVLVVIRLLWERGARPGGSIVPGAD